MKNPELAEQLRQLLYAVEIPPTSQPGVVHHARLGSMESNIFTLVGNRMKGRRACWSIRGANCLALLLCRRHSVRTEDFFAELPTLPEPESPEPEDAGSPLSAAQIPETVGKSGQCYCHSTLPNEVWLQTLDRLSVLCEFEILTFQLALVQNIGAFLPFCLFPSPNAPPVSLCQRFLHTYHAAGRKIARDKRTKPCYNIRKEIVVYEHSVCRKSRTENINSHSESK